MYQSNVNVGSLNPVQVITSTIGSGQMVSDVLPLLRWKDNWGLSLTLFCFAISLLE